MKSHGEEPESHDEVIREVRRIKEELAAAQGFDIRRICEEARKNQEASERTGQVIISAPRKARSKQK